MHVTAAAITGSGGGVCAGPFPLNTAAGACWCPYSFFSPTVAHVVHPVAAAAVHTAGLSPGEALCRHENWCGVLQEVALPACGGDPATFLSAAVEYANKQCWGTLACRWGRGVPQDKGVGRGKCKGGGGGVDGGEGGSTWRWD